MTSDTFLNASINHAFEFMERRAKVIEKTIALHREVFGMAVVEPSIDAICLGMVSLAALGKYRFKAETKSYRDQFRKLLKEYCGPLFEDRISIPDFLDRAHYNGAPTPASLEVRRCYALPIGAQKYDPNNDPIVAAFITFLGTKQLVVKPSDLESSEYSTIIYKKYRNPIVHALQIADGDEPLNMWHDRPGVFYSSKLKPSDAGTLEPSYQLGVTDDYVLMLFREAIKNLRDWCISEGKHIF